MTEQPDAPMSERMQALLSRAVEDQLSEQRQLATLVAEVRALLAALPGEVVAAAPVDDSVRQEVTRMRSSLAAIEQRLELLTAAAQRSGGGDSVAALEAKVDALAQSVQEQERRITAHVDEAVLALAEVLVRRRAGGSPRGADLASPGASAAAAGESAAPAPAPEIAPVEVPQPAPPQGAPPQPSPFSQPPAVESLDAQPEPEPEPEPEPAAEEPDADLAPADVEVDEQLDAQPVDAQHVDAPPAMADDNPWRPPSPFQPGPARESEAGAAAALDELRADAGNQVQDEDEDAADDSDRPRRKPWWRPGD